MFKIHSGNAWIRPRFIPAVDACRATCVDSADVAPGSGRRFCSLMVDDAPRGRPKRPRSVDASAHSAPSVSDSLHSSPKNLAGARQGWRRLSDMYPYEHKGKQPG